MSNRRSPRQARNTRCFIPHCHIEYQIQRAARERFPDFSGGTRLSSNAIHRLEKALATLIGLHHGGLVSATQKFIGARMGKSDRAVRNDIRDLEALGLVETIQNYDKGQLRVNNTYRLHPLTYLWRKGKQLAKAATAATVTATEGLTSRICKRIKRLHEAYREQAQNNLKQFSQDTERNSLAELPPLSSKEIQNPDKQTPAASRPSRSAKVLELVRQFGVSATSRMTRISEETIRNLMRTDKQTQ